MPTLSYLSGRQRAGSPISLTAFLFAVLIFLSACTGSPSVENGSVMRIALKPSDYPETISLRQLVQVNHNGREVELDAVLDISPEAVTLVGMVYGQRVFTLRYDGTTLEESRSMMMPREIRGSDILSDMQLSLWPTASIRAALPAEWSLSDSSEQRVLSRGEQAIISITYENRESSSPLLRLVNHEVGYSLFIRSAAQDQ